MAHWEKCEAIDLQEGDVTLYGKVLSVSPIDEEFETVEIAFDCGEFEQYGTFYAYSELRFKTE